MAAYRRVYGFGHLWADCRGLGSAPEPYAPFEYGTFVFNLIITLVGVCIGVIEWLPVCVCDHWLTATTSARHHHHYCCCWLLGVHQSTHSSTQLHHRSPSTTV